MLAAIQPNSVAAAIIAKSLEDGAGLRRAHEDAMDYQRRRHKAGEPDVQFWGLTATQNFYISMLPTVTPVQYRAQGSNDPNLAWCQVNTARVGRVTDRGGEEATLVPGKEPDFSPSPSRRLG